VQHHPQPQHHQHLPQQLPVNTINHVALNDTQTQPIQAHQQPTVVPVQPVASTSAQANSPGGAIVAKGDWTKDLVHLAKTAELKCV
jgi:hypothetical protein